MDVKTEIILSVPQQAAGTAVNAAAGMPNPAPAPSGSGTDGAKVQKVLRDALNVEPVADRELRIEFADDLNMIVVKVLDKESGEIIRQIPMPEELSIARQLRAWIDRMAREQRGIVVDQEV